MGRPLTDPVLEALASDGSARWFVEVIGNLSASVRREYRNNSGLCLRCAVVEELRELRREGRAVLERPAGWRRVLH